MAHIKFTDILAKKRDGLPLTVEEIAFFIKGILNDEVQEVQIGAMLMAMYLKGLTVLETTALTRSMLQSGKSFQWPAEWKPFVFDKHSTGGVGDKVSLILAPALAACGLKVPMISGRGLGFTGGTIDKLESIPGFRSTLTEAEAFETLEKVGCFIMAQTSEICPADSILYASRDVTATVDNISLITASILSKKAAEDLTGLVLDIKCGRAAFCRDYASAKSLADLMFKVGNELGIKTAVTITRMDQPLGRMIGNALEVRESIECLKGHGPADLDELVELQGGILLTLAKKANSIEEGKLQIAASLKNGSALEKFFAMIIAQGVHPDVADSLCLDPKGSCLPVSQFVTDIGFEYDSAYVTDIDALEIAKISGELGAARFKKGEKINHAVGLELLTKAGSLIHKDQPWVRVHHDTKLISESHLKRLISAIRYTAAETKSTMNPPEQQILEIIY